MMTPRHRARQGLACLLALITIVCLACGTARRRPPLGPAPALSEQAATGRVAFMQKCDRCHPGGEAGLGPALNDKPFPDFLKRFQIRHGLGTMPHFSREELSDPQLDAILEYLKALNQNPDAARGRSGPTHDRRVGSTGDLN
jgi:mono/diheme cytochrome c family protein